MELERKLQLLAEYGAKAADEASARAGFRDEAAALAPARADAWAGLLSSIVSAEAAEALVMTPVVTAFAPHPLVHEFLRTHNADEGRHADMIRDYVRATFRYERKKKTLGSKVIYDHILPIVSRATSRVQPLIILVLIYFYEIYSQHIYTEVKRVAAADGLSELLRMVEIIEKDERRHLAGIESIYAYYASRVRTLGAGDRALTRAALQLARVDLAQAPWAFHNRRLRGRLEVLGISPADWDRRSVFAIEACMKLARDAGVNRGEA